MDTPTNDGRVELERRVAAMWRRQEEDLVPRVRRRVGRSRHSEGSAAASARATGYQSATGVRKQLVIHHRSVKSRARCEAASRKPVGEVARGLSLFGGASSEVRRCNCSVVDESRRSLAGLDARCRCLSTRNLSIYLKRICIRVCPLPATARPTQGRLSPHVTGCRVRARYLKKM